MVLQELQGWGKGFWFWFLFLIILSGFFSHIPQVVFSYYCILIWEKKIIQFLTIPDPAPLAFFKG